MKPLHINGWRVFRQRVLAVELVVIESPASQSPEKRPEKIQNLGMTRVQCRSAVVENGLALPVMQVPVRVGFDPSSISIWD